MEKHKYSVCFLGDDALEGVFEMEPEKFAIFEEVLSYLHPDGKYAPMALITDLTEEEKKQKEIKSKLQKEAENAQIRRAIALDRKTPTAIEIAFNKAMRQQ